jgi:hypothetical protein
MLPLFMYSTGRSEISYRVVPSKTCCIFSNDESSSEDDDNAEITLQRQEQSKEERQSKDAEVKDVFRVGGDRRKVILEEAGTWASCVPDLTSFNFYLFIYFISILYLFLFFFIITY